MCVYTDFVKKLNPNVDAEAVLDVANDLYRYFGEMTVGEWEVCIDLVITEGLTHDSQAA
jgi:hypothetical protein